MSWSVSKVGKAAAVRKAVAEELARQKCSEPEETVKNTVAAAIDAALAAFPAGSAVEVSANGSQSVSSSAAGSPSDGAVNQLNVVIKPIWSFLELPAEDAAV